MNHNKKMPCNVNKDVNTIIVKYKPTYIPDFNHYYQTLSEFSTTEAVVNIGIFVHIKMFENCANSKVLELSAQTSNKYSSSDVMI